MVAFARRNFLNKTCTLHSLFFVARYFIHISSGFSTTGIELSPMIALNIIILFAINLLNYMDRYTVAGVLTNLQECYGINDARGGFLQTIFIVFYMISSPICGFLGDRHVRKWILVAGVAIWVLAVLASSFVPANMFWLFLLCRGVVGIGEASWAVISPTIIADMFSGVSRSRILMFFYFAIPCGSGLGFMVASSVAAYTGDWRWGVRATTILGVVCLILLMVFMTEPERGAAEKQEGGAGKKMIYTSYCEDLRSLAKNATYISSTAGYTTLIFMVTSLIWWAPTVIEHNYAHKQGLNSTEHLSQNIRAEINFVFGALTCVGGIAGVTIGSILSQWLHTGFGPFRFVKTPRSDPIVCGIGAFIGVPTLYFAVREIPHNMMLAWTIMFICMTAVSFNWATHVNMLMEIVVPTRRNTAHSLQILTSNLFAEAPGPYILGMVSDAIRGGDASPYGNFMSLMISFYYFNIIVVISGFLFIVAACTFVRDHRIFQKEMGEWLNFMFLWSVYAASKTFFTD